MEIVLIILGMMVLLSIKGVIDNKNRKRRLLTRLEQSWGKLPVQEYTEEKFNSLEYYYNHRYKANKSGFYLDEITWNDLNLNQLFFRLNATGSAMGEEYLWALLHEPNLNAESLQERERLMGFFKTNPDTRLKLQFAFASIGKNKKLSVFEYMDRINNVKREKNIIHYAVLGVFVLSIGLLLTGIPYAGFLLIGGVVYNILTYYRRKGEISSYFSVMSYLIRMIEHAEKIAAENSEELLQPYCDKMTGCTSKLKKLKKGAYVVAPENPTGDIMSFLMDYVRILFHTDLIRFNSMLEVFFENKDDIIEIFEIIGLLDAMCATASFRESLPYYSTPEFVPEICYHAEGLYHPFLEEPVPADISTTQSVLVTGSNASGKSTFIKAAAMNSIMAQTIHTICAKTYRAPFYKTMTSMALTDNLFGNESYYIVEIKSLQRILNETKKEIPVLGFIDEVLRGTNTVERIAASSEILGEMARSNALMFAATHDIELTYMLESSYSNYHFEEQIAENEILFDYKLKSGRAMTQNAIALLGMLGYPEAIIKNAKETAVQFLSTGEWRKVKE